MPYTLILLILYKCKDIYMEQQQQVSLCTRPCDVANTPTNMVYVQCSEMFTNINWEET